MEFNDAHISDEELLMAIDGELLDEEATEIHAHITACAACRVRSEEIEDAIAVYQRIQRRHLDAWIPPAAGPRARLQSRLAEIPRLQEVPMPGVLPSAPQRSSLPPLWLQVAAVALIAALGTVAAGRWAASHRAGRKASAFSVPDSSLTPGATILASRNQVCSGSTPNNRSVPASLQRKVFEEYGIPGAKSVAYEVDYLITPALGGADDIHNLWPQSYSQTVWNARVKDALEDRLRDLVCEGRLDLATAQRDISADWIAAYKKYFQTDRPLETTNP